ncbi:phage terminase large subunit [Synechococcus sp. A15-60]|uniref:phage terminase large subunit n=1 Tax=Synechococcus sp. A15-60 TaxID=1050655 RepID=UPI0016478970|nr:phage terminase large subunit [Synechococcus sp. A15-60]
MALTYRRKPNQPPSQGDKRLRENRNKPPANVTSETGLPELLDHQRMAISVPDDSWLVMAGGRGGGKSWTLALLLVRDALRFGKSFRAALLRTDLAGLKKLQQLIEEFANQIPQLAGTRYLVGQKTFEFGNGGKLFLHYLKDENAFARFQGEDLSHLAIDEIAQISEPGPVLRLCSSLRSPDPAIKPRLICTGNPGNVGSLWLFENVISRATPWQPFHCELFNHSMVVCHSTVHDNSFLDVDGYVATLKASSNNDPAKILAEVWGDWSATPASFFGHALSEQRSKVPWIGAAIAGLREFSTRDLWLGMDFGVRAPSAVVLAYRTRTPIKLPDGRVIAPKSLILLDEYYSCLREKDGTRRWELGDATLTVQTLARAVEDLLARNGMSLKSIPQNHRIADAQIGAATGGMDGSIGHQLGRFGCKFAAGPKGSRATGWALMASLMANAGSELPGLYATERCEAFWATAPLAQHDTAKQDDLVLNADHCLDACRYLLMATADQRYSGSAGQTKFKVW